NDTKVLDRINNLIQEAIHNTEYYSKNSHLYPRLNSIEDIKKIPILKKEIFKQLNDSFISKKSNKWNSYSFKTSGSTGTPLYGKLDLQELRARFLVVLSSQKELGIDYSKR